MPSSRNQNYVNGGSDRRIRADLDSRRHLDRELPCAAVFAVMEACYHGPDRRAPVVARFYFAVTAEADGEVGALALFAPYDTGGSTFFEPVGFHVHLSRCGVPGEPAALCAALRPKIAGLPAWQLDETYYAAIVPEGEVPFGAALQAADAAFRAGVRLVTLWGEATPAQRAAFGGAREPGGVRTSGDLRALVAASPPSARPPHLRLEGVALTGPAPPMPPVARVRGGYAGLPELRKLVEEIEESGEIGDFEPIPDAVRTEPAPATSPERRR